MCSSTNVDFHGGFGLREGIENGLVGGVYYGFAPVRVLGLKPVNWSWSFWAFDV